MLVVGFQHLVRPGEVNDVGRRYDEALEKAFGDGATPDPELPHCVIVEHIGLEPEPGAVQTYFFSPHILNPEPNFVSRVLPLLAKAIDA